MTQEELEQACIDFEDEHGMEAFLDAMAEIMQHRLARHGLSLEFAESEMADSAD